MSPEESEAKSQVLVPAPELPQDAPKVKPRRRVYSEQQIAQALAVYDACGNGVEAERLTGIPDSTLSCWAKGERRNLGAIPQIRNKTGKELTESFQEIAFEACRVSLDRLRNPRKANKIPFAQLISGAGIAVDKFQLLSGLPTSISSSVMSDDDRKLKIAEVLARIAGRASQAETPPE